MAPVRDIVLRAATAIALTCTSVLAEPGQSSSITIIGPTYPLSVECFENARDGKLGADGLRPCGRALEEETLTDRRRAIVYANRGVINYNTGAYEAAIQDFTQSLDLKIFVRSRILANRGLAYEALRLDALARADYSAALALIPKNGIAQRRFEELKKPLYERSLAPRRITAEAQPPADPS